MASKVIDFERHKSRRVEERSGPPGYVQIEIGSDNAITLSAPGLSVELSPGDCRALACHLLELARMAKEAEE